MSISRPGRSKFGPIALLGAVGLAAVLSAGGCDKTPSPFVPKDSLPHTLVYCNDTTGHRAGARPWIDGGTCTCTPSEALMVQLHRDGLCVGESAEQLTARYRAAGIALRGPGHEHCDGLCPAGPHVVLGGKCMCPPTPGTLYYEQVVTGRGAPPRGAPAPAGGGQGETR